MLPVKERPATTVALPRRIGGLREIAADYDGYLVDLWGVLHDGVRPYAGAIECLEALARAGKRVVILSNAPRRAAEVRARTAAIGVAGTLYEDLICSGEETWRELREWHDPFYAGLDRRFYPIMAARDRGMLEGLAIEPVATIEAASFILNTGVEGAEDGVAQFEPLLDRARAHDLPMICANPDLVVIRGGLREICAGAVAEAYERRGGRVRYHGKPHRGVYARCFERLAPLPPSRILAVGDSLRTDIAGAGAVGIASLFILDGIHAEELGGAEVENPGLAALFDRWPHRPTAVASRFLW